MGDIECENVGFFCEKLRSVKKNHTFENQYAMLSNFVEIRACNVTGPTYCF